MAIKVTSAKTWVAPEVVTANKLNLTGTPIVGDYNVTTIALAKTQSYAFSGQDDQFSVAGYYTAGDGGGGLFRVDRADTTTADNGGTVIVASDGTRLKALNTSAWDVRRSGAKLDGVTNDSAAWQSAVDNAQVVTSISGSTYWRDPVTLNNFNRIFASEGTVIIPGTNCGSYVLKAVGKTKILMEGLSVVFTPGTTPQTIQPQGTFGSASALFFENCSGVTVRKFQSTDMYGSINFYNCQNCISDGAYCPSCLAGIAIVADNTYAGTPTVYGCSVINSRILNGADDGIAVLSRNSGVIYSCEVVNNYITKTSRPNTGPFATGIRVALLGGTSIDSITVSNNQMVDMVDEAMRISGGANFVISGNVTRGYSKRTGQVGAYWLSQITNSCFTDNLAYLPTANTIAMTFVSCSGCIIKGNQATSTVGGDGAAHFTTCTRNQVINNRWWNTSAYGISVANDCSNNLFRDNDVSTFAANGINIGTDATNQFINNSGFITRNGGIQPVPGGTSSRVVSHGLSNPRTSLIKIRVTNYTDPQANTGTYVDESTITSTQFTVKTHGAPASNMDFQWEAWEEGP